jgi:CubicO group peptidase (beta-lactamase class C family)
MSRQQAIALAISVMMVVLLLVGCGLPATEPTSEPAATLTPPSAPTASAALEPTSPPSDYWPTQNWRSSTPEEQGMDSHKLALMLEAVEQEKLQLHSLLVVRNGYLVSETYFPPYSENSREELYSCTKSFIATLLGIAIDQGYIDSIQHPVLDFFPERSFENRDAAKEAMTVEDLLTMRSGLDWEEGDPAYQGMYQSSDWVKFVLDKPMREQPGGQFNYCSGCSHILSAIIQQQSGVNTHDFAQKELFEPLGITSMNWSVDRMGVPIGGWGLQLTPREMAKLGYLYLHDGAWDGQQIVSSAWVKSATQMHTNTDSLRVAGYGYQWWLYPSLDAYTALGRFGQTIFVAPDLNLMVVTSAKLSDAEGHEPIYDLIEAYIVPAVQNP